MVTVTIGYSHGLFQSLWLDLQTLVTQAHVIGYPFPSQCVQDGTWQFASPYYSLVNNSLACMTNVCFAVAHKVTTAIQEPLSLLSNMVVSLYQVRAASLSSPKVCIQISQSPCTANLSLWHWTPISLLSNLSLLFIQRSPIYYMAFQAIRKDTEVTRSNLVGFWQSL